MRVALLLVVVAFVHATTISVKDPNWYFTEYNWQVDPSGQFAQTSNPGAYFKVD